MKLVYDHLESFFIVEEGKNQGLHKETIETLIYFIDIINSNTLRAMKKYLENEYSKREYGGIPLDIFDMLIQYKKDKNLDSIKLALECWE